MNDRAKNQKKFAFSVGAILVAAILKAMAININESLEQWIGQSSVIWLHRILLGVLLIIFVVIWREKAAALLRAAGKFLDRIIRLFSLDKDIGDIKSRLGFMSKEIEKFKEVESRLKDMSKEINTILATLPVSLTWVLELQGDVELRKKTLRKIRKVISNIRKKRATMVIPDEQLAQVIEATGSKELFSTRDVNEWDILFDLRQATYGLSDKDYSTTKNALKLSAEERLGKSDESVEESMVRAYAEVTKTANRWEFCQLAQDCFKQLQNIRASRQFVDSFEKRSVTLNPSYSSMSFLNEHGHRRVWKRVWPNNGSAWGRLACLINGGKCTDGLLVEVSLCGAYCRNCQLDRGAQIDGLELDLPYVKKLVKVRSARLTTHDGQFATDGTRLNKGFGIEFLDMREADFNSLARYIRKKEELNSNEPPPNAPWQQRSSH